MNLIKCPHCKGRGKHPSNLTPDGVTCGYCFGHKVVSLWSYIRWVHTMRRIYEAGNMPKM